MEIDELKKTFFNGKLTWGMAVFLLFFVGLALVFWPVLSGQKIFNDYYVTNYAVGQTGYNFYKDFGNNLREFRLQLWSPSYMAGFPVYLTQVGFFNPLGIFLFTFFDYIFAYNWLTFLNFLFAGLAMYWCIRNLKLSKLAAILGGFAWTLSFNNIQYGSIPIFSNTYLFIPLFFGAILKLSEGSKKYLIFGSLVSGFGLIAGMTNIVFYVFITGFFWALFLFYFHSSNNGSICLLRKLQPIFNYIVIVLGGAVLASAWLLPVFNYLPHTLRGEAVSASIFYDYLKIGDTLRFFYPFIQLPGFSGFTLLSGVANLYIGIVPLFLATIAIFLWRKNKFIAFWTALFIFAFSMRLWFFPIFQWTQYLPLFNRFRAPFHWYSLAFFSISILSAYGLNYIEEIKSSRWFKNFVKIIGIFAVLNILIAVAVNLTVKFFRGNILNLGFGFFDKYLFAGKKYSVDYYHEIISQVFDKSAETFSFSNYHFSVSLLFILIGIALLFLYKRDYLDFTKFKIAAVAVTILNLTLIWQGYYNFTSKELITNSPDTIKFIQNQPSSDKFRFFRFYPPEMYQEFGFYNVKNYQDYDIKTLGLQINPYWVDGFGGGEPFRSQRISEILDEVGYEVPLTYSKPSWIKSSDLNLNQKVSRFSSTQNINLLSMLNIKYIFSSFRLDNLNLIYETTATEKNIPVYIYENSQVMPRIYFTKNVKFVESENALEELLKVKGFHELTLIENSKSEILNPKQILNSKSQIQIEEMKSELVKIKTFGSGGWLVYSDANLPTWEAYIDGDKTEIYAANYLFKAVFVPKGEHEIIFKYPNLWRQFKYAAKNIF